MVSLQRRRWAFFIILLITFKSLIDIYYIQVPFFYTFITGLALFAVFLIILTLAIAKGKAAFERETQFLSNLGHELRTPMISIIGAADLMEDENPTAIQSDHLKSIKMSGFNLLGIIDNILDLNNLERGKAGIHLTSSLVKNIIDSCTFEMSSLLQNKGVNLQIELTENIDKLILLDEAKCRQIMLVLLHRAIDNAQSGTIRLTAELEKKTESAGRLLFSIIYKGIYAQVPATNPLCNANDTLVGKEFASRLGMYFCRELAQHLGGDLYSKNKIDQNFIQLNLPVKILADRTASIPGSNRGNIALINTYKQLKVLLVEDNALNTKILIEMLGKFGFEVTTAENGLQCLQILQEHFFDVILMDMQMPVMDGYETSRIIKDDPALQYIPIIAVTANAMIGDREKCLASGCTSYLAKPFLTQELLQEIEMVTRGAKGTKTFPGRNQHRGEIYLNQECLYELDQSILALATAIECNDWAAIKHLCQGIKALGRMQVDIDIYYQAALLEAAADKRMVKIIDLSLLELKKHCRYQKDWCLKTGTSLE